MESISSIWEFIYCKTSLKSFSSSRLTIIDTVESTTVTFFFYNTGDILRGVILQTKMKSTSSIPKSFLQIHLYLAIFFGHRKQRERERRTAKTCWNEMLQHNSSQKEHLELHVDINVLCHHLWTKQRQQPSHNLNLKNYNNHNNYYNK